MAFTGQQFKDGSDASIVGADAKGVMSTQLQSYFYQRKALLELKKEMYFTTLADVTAMP